MNKPIEKFEDLEVWQEGMRLSVKIYNYLRDCRDFALRDQMQRASVSIPSNISEGFERNSNKEFIQFLYIAKSSYGELRTQIYLYKKLGKLSVDKSQELLEQTRKLLAMLYNLIQTRVKHF